MYADRNLLYVLAAIRVGCTDSAGLIAACAECQTGSQLTKMLVDRRCLSLPQANKIERGVEQLIQEHGGDARAALHATLDTSAKLGEATLSGEATVSFAFPSATVRGPAAEQTEREIADKTRAPLADRTVAAEDPELTAVYLHQRPLDADATLDMDTTLSAALLRLDATDSRNRYSLTRVHGSGGLGQVWLAVDRHLNRQVALKEMRPDRGASQQALRRLVKEAQITGQLEHPNIVPVYELSGSPEGKNIFYTMRFLRGETLKEAIDQHHGKSGKPAGDGVQLRHLLQAFVGICNAMAYAGSKGIVHRDLKPQNVMLGSFGEVIVLDWGLAKKVDEPDEDAAAAAPAIAITEDAATTKTLEGQVLGTPGYLSPEQARGDLQSIDPRTDVYGLGAILFAILTGQPPHRMEAGSKQGTQAMMKAIIEGATPEPKSLKPATPAALNAICLKAMATHREDRYSSASELAEDISRWIADEPVTAHVERWGVRLARWMRRHRTWTQAAAIILLVVAGVSTAATIIVSGARHREEVARRNAEQAWQDERVARAAEAAAKADATRRFHDAQVTVHRSLTGVSRVLLYFPGVEPLRAELLERAAQDLERFAAEDSQDLQLQIEAGRAIVRLGDVRRLLYQWDAAERQYRRGDAHFVRLLKREPQHLGIKKEVADCRKELAFTLATLGRDEEATALYGQLVPAYRELVDKSPDSNEYRLAHATALYDVAQHHVGMGDESAAIDGLEQAEAAFERLVDQQGNSEYEQGLATAQRLHAQILSSIGQNVTAVEKLTAAVAGFQTLQIAEPDQPDYVEEVADCHVNLGNTLLTMGREQESLALYRGAIADYELLLTARPGVPQYRESMALIRRNVAQQLHRSGRAREAYDDALAALKVFDELVSSNPGIPRYHSGEAACSLTFGQILRDLSQDALAQAAFGKAIQKYTELAQEAGDDSQDGTNLAISYTALGRLLQRRKEPEAAQQAFQKSADLLAASAAAGDATPYVQDALAWSYSRLADLLHQQDRQAEATGYYEKTLAIRDKLTEHPAHRYNLAWFLTRCPDAAQRDPQRAATIASQLIAIVPDNADYHNLLGVTHFRAQEWDAAVAALRKAASLREQPHPADVLFLAMTLWQQGNKQEAVDSFQQAVQVIDQQQPGNPELIELRQEAAVMLEVEQSADESAS